MRGPAKIKVLVIGGGGREHALAWKAAQSPRVARVYVAPGNAGSAAEKRVENIDIDAGDIDLLADFAERREIGLTIVGPEAPLVAGIADAFAARKLACFGPGRDAARLEGSKSFAKEFLRRHEIPTAAHRSFTEAAAARAHLAERAYPAVVKADGLAGGKGVVVAARRRDAEDALDAMLGEKRFGEAGSRVVIEDFLEGEEVSFICIVGGGEVLPLASSQDHKAAHDGDTGPNTGGMGAYSPAPLVDAAMHARILDAVIRPALRGMERDGMQYTGFLYAGLMIGEDRVPRVLEFNCRLGDPEAQPLLLRMRSDLVAHCQAALRGELGAERAQWDARAALGVVLAADGYPGEARIGMPIDGPLHASEAEPPRKVFHAATAAGEAGGALVAGGRVLCATACGDDVRAAARGAYRLAEQIEWRGRWYRGDIGHRAIAREEAAVTAAQPA